MQATEVVLFDRDGTLIEDVPYNGDPARVRPMGTAQEAVDLLRAHGIRLGVVSNQSGVARGLIDSADVHRVNAEVDRIFGGFDTWHFCPHGPEEACRCRKPAPGLVEDACAALGADPARTVVIGDIGSDMGAAAAAGARGVLVPTEVTLATEVTNAPRVASTLIEAARIAAGIIT